MFIGQICYCVCSFATSRRHLTYVGLLKKRARMRRGRQPSIHSIRSRPGPRIETREKPMTSSLPLARRHRKRITGVRLAGRTLRRRPQKALEVRLQLVVEVGQSVLKHALHLQALGVHPCQDVQLCLVQHARVAVNLWDTVRSVQCQDTFIRLPVFVFA